MSISNPESSGYLASGWSPGETLGYWNFITAGILWLKTMQAVMGRPIKKNNFFEFSRVSPGDQPLAKEPEDSGYDIGLEIWSCRPTSVENS